MREGYSGYYRVSVSSEEPLLTQMYVLAYDWDDEPASNYTIIYALVDGMVKQVGMAKRSVIYREDGLVYSFWDDLIHIANLDEGYINVKVEGAPYRILSSDLEGVGDEDEITLYDMQYNIDVGTFPKSDIKVIKEDQMFTEDKAPPYGVKLSEVIYNSYSYYVMDCGADILDLWQVTADITSPTLVYFSKVSRYEVRFIGATAKVAAPSESPKTPTEIWCDTLFDFKVLQWAEERNLLAGGTVDGQFQKLVEELGELARALARDDMGEVRDSIGDMDVVLTILAKQLGVTRSECREAAYNEIKDRKGTMCGGVFIKD